ncbi:MAG: DUF6125 family protein [Dehalococcoidia bacterium]
MGKLVDYSGEFSPDLKLSDFSPDTLVQLVKLYSKLYMAMDGFWYLSVKGRVGGKEALACDIKVWEDMVKYETLMIKRQLKIRGSDIASLMKVTQLCPWFQLTSSSIEIKDSRRATLTVAYCPTLESLEAKSEGTEYETCNVVCRKINEIIASQFGPDIAVSCLKLPPRKSRDDICCQWEFRLGS